MFRQRMRKSELLTRRETRSTPKSNAAIYRLVLGESTMADTNMSRLSVAASRWELGMGGCFLGMTE